MLTLVTALLGLLIGSFLNVVVWRVPRGESLISPPSHCPRCQTPVAPRDNVPVLGWLLLRGRCRSCREPISWRYPAVELLTGALFAAVAVRFGLHATLPAYLYLTAVGVALALIDLDTLRLPNVIVLPSYAVAALLTLLPALVDNSWGSFLRGLAAGAAYYGAFFLLAFIYPAGMGFGDVKLAGVLGIFLGYLSWAALAVGAFAGVLLGAVVGVALLATRRKSRKSAIPFGPAMIAGAFIAVFAAAPLARGYTTLVLGGS